MEILLTQNYDQGLLGLILSTLTQLNSLFMFISQFNNNLIKS